MVKKLNVKEAQDSSERWSVVMAIAPQSKSKNPSAATSINSHEATEYM